MKIISHPGTIIVLTLIGAYLILGFITGNWKLNKYNAPAGARVMGRVPHGRPNNGGVGYIISCPGYGDKSVDTIDQVMSAAVDCANGRW